MGAVNMQKKNIDVFSEITTVMPSHDNIIVWKFDMQMMTKSELQNVFRNVIIPAFPDNKCIALPNTTHLECYSKEELQLVADKILEVIETM